MRKITKAIAVMVTVCMCLCSPATALLVHCQSETDIELYNIAILKNNCSFNINSDGLATCYSTVSAQNGYTVQVVMQLQQKGTGMWKTVQSWNDTDESFVVLDKTYQVEKGYDYRLMVVYIAYDSNGNQVESFYDMSSVVEYK